MNGLLNFVNGGALPTTSFTAGRVMPFPRDIPAGKRMRIHENPLSNITPLTHGDAVDDGGEIISQVNIIRERWQHLPRMHASSQPGIQPGSLVFTTTANNPLDSRGHSLQAINAILHMLNEVGVVRRVDQIAKEFKFAGVATTEQSDRNNAHRAHLPLYSASGATSSMHRLMHYGKWENVVDVWSDSYALFAYADNPGWAHRLRHSVSSTLVDGTTLCLALLPMNKRFICPSDRAAAERITFNAHPFADWYGVDMLNDPDEEDGVTLRCVYQYVPIALKPGVVPSVHMFAEPPHVFRAEDVLPCMLEGMTMPIQLYTIGTVHMRNSVDVIDAVTRFPDPRRLLFPATMEAAVAAISMSEGRKKVPVQIAWSLKR